tara:strand:+ start:42 stop:365 length:324 start_codon:yes stop_codon:yes gene_type:complete
MPANMKKSGMKYKMGGPRKKVMSKEKMGDTGYMHGGMTKKKMMKKGGSLKDVPSGNKGLPKLPTAVRNKMGFKQDGGMMNSVMSNPILAAKKKMMMKGGMMKKSKKY